MAASRRIGAISSRLRWHTARCIARRPDGDQGERATGSRRSQRLSGYRRDDLVSLSAGLSGFREMFDGEPAQILRAIGYFGDGDLNTLSAADRDVVCNAQDRIGKLPAVHLKPGSLAGR